LLQEIKTGHKLGGLSRTETYRLDLLPFLLKVFITGTIIPVPSFV